MAPPRRQPFSERVVRTSRAFAYALAASVGFSFLPLPWFLIGLPCAVLALVLGIVALVAMRGTDSPGLWTFSVVGLTLAGILALDFGVTILLYDARAAYEKCAAEAITIAAMDLCSREYDQAVEERLEELGLAWYSGSD